MGEASVPERVPTHVGSVAAAGIERCRANTVSMTGRRCGRAAVVRAPQGVGGHPAGAYRSSILNLGAVAGHDVLTGAAIRFR
jgi:hypothetical protein